MRSSRLCKGLEVGRSGVCFKKRWKARCTGAREGEKEPCEMTEEQVAQDHSYPYNSTRRSKQQA